jgi:DNA-binding NarL/FixJ family response regulator
MWVDPSSVLRVVIVEDEALFRDLLRVALAQQPGIEVIAALSDSASALATTLDLRPDVVLLDIELGAPPNGVEVARRLREVQPGLGVVILSNHGAPEFVASLPLGACGWSYLLKKSVGDLAALRRAIEGAAAGMITLDPQIVEQVSQRQEGRLAALTPRKREILALIAEGRSNAAIAKRLMVTERTVENQISLLYRTLRIARGQDVHARVRAVLLYLDSISPATRSLPLRDGKSMKRGS